LEEEEKEEKEEEVREEEGEEKKLLLIPHLCLKVLRLMPTRIHTRTRTHTLVCLQVS